MCLSNLLEFINNTMKLYSPGVRKPFGELTNTPPTPRHHLSQEKTPLKQQTSSPSTEPALTPLANLKLLMRVASEQPSRRELFKEENEENRTETVANMPDHDYGHEVLMPVENQQPVSTTVKKVSRKEKSLGLLCDKFVNCFPRAVPQGEKCEIHLDDLAKQMNTERRRIYDIVNVLEAVQMMTKVNIISSYLYVTYCSY